jgi:hypothetical protein
MKVIYKITYPNGKIYIGKGPYRYAELLWQRRQQSDQEGLSQERKERDFTIRKEILFESEVAVDRELNAKEVELIISFRSNDPAIGYNHWPRFR